MKRFNIPQYLLAAMAMLAIYSCSKSSGEDVYTGQISLSPHIIQNQSRVNTGFFEANDTIGLYIVPFDESNTTPGEISSLSYAANIGFTYDGVSWNTVSGSKVYWSDGTTKTDFYAYYPYDKNLVGSNPRNYSFAIKADQQTKKGYEASDFLWAKTSAVSPTKDPVDLSFYHKLSKIRINVKTELPGLDVQLADATTSILNTEQVATIDLADGSATAGSAGKSTILVFQHSTPVNGYILSAEAILIPQTVQSGIPLIQIAIPSNGSTYTYTPTSSIVFESGKERTINITITSLGLVVSVGSIVDWLPSDIIEGEIGKPLPKVLDLNDINWDESLVQKIYDNGVQVGQVCREYLFRSASIDAQVITIYRMTAEGTTDESSAFVAQVMNRTPNGTTGIFEPNTANVHGGTVVWAGTNTISSYTAGNNPLFNKVEISATATTPAASNAIVSLNIVPDELVDVDNNSYRIVKIGKQYWMAENLKVERYRDGSPLTYYYYNNDNANKQIFGALYDWNTANSANGIGPVGWSVPTDDQLYNQLRVYLSTTDTGKKLKLPNLWLYPIYCDNVTGFAMLPGGRRTNTGVYNQMYYYGELWSSTAYDANSAYRMYFDYSNTGTFRVTLEKNYTQAVRLIRNP